MSIQLHAQPYDMSARGFFFKTLEEYKAKYDKNLNDYGEPVEEYEMQFIDGSEWSDGQAALDALGLELFFDIADTWKIEDINRLEMFIEHEGAGNLKDNESDILDQLNDVIHVVDSSRQSFYFGMMEDFYPTLTSKLIEIGAYDYFDEEGYLKGNMEGHFGYNNGVYYYWSYEA